tara:strand:- start:9366 stop:10673 length:1308 start_codon:yes stop_codon:yes gene_type:complete
MANRRSQTKTGGGAETKGHIPGLYSLAVGMPPNSGPDGWTWTKLSEVARLETGHTPSRKHPEYWDGDIPWIGIRDATANHGQTLVDTNQHTNNLGIENSSARMLPKNTVCLSRTASVGYVVVMGRPMATSQDFVNWVCSEKIDHQFLKYILLSENRSFASFASGTTHQTIYFPEVKGFHVCLPPIGTQQKIAAILSAYDDLIENNTRRIAILEEMAQSIYREWFVNFRFPSHEKVKLVDSPIGSVPDGWLKHLGDVVTLKRGYDLPKKKRRKGRIPIVSSSGITDFHDEAMVKGPGVVTGRYGTLGQVFYISGEFWPLNTSLYVKDFQGNKPLLILHLLRQLDLARQNVAGAVPGLNRNALHMMDVAFPPIELQERISPFFSDIEKRLDNLKRKNRNLRVTRDLLLPKLISGKFNVEDLDIEIGELAESMEEVTA